MRQGYRVSEVSAVLRETGAEVRAQAVPDGDQYAVVLPLDQLRHLAARTGDVADLWMHLTPDQRETQDATASAPRDPVRLGKFTTTEREAAATSTTGSRERVVVTQKGNLSLSFGEQTRRKFQVTVGERRSAGSVPIYDIEVRCGDRPAVDVRVVAVARESEGRYLFHGTLVHLPEEGRADQGRWVQSVSITVDLEDLAARIDDRVELLDLYVEVEDADGRVQTSRIKSQPGDREVAWGPVSLGGDVLQVVPHTTFRGGNRSLRVERMGADVYRAIRRWSRLARWLPLVRPILGIWLVGELPYKAQDNGYHLFRWIRQSHPRRRAYYVIDGDAPDLRRLEGLGNVVLRNSREHVRVAFLASRLVGTHHAEYLLPSRDPRTIAGARGVRVFLRHGISGTKNMVANYGRFAPGFSTDRFHVSSDREREVAIKEFGYRPAQVRVTGLPRFDQLLAPSDRPPSGILVIPTWREWLVHRDSFETSAYRDQWQAFLSHPQLAELMRGGLRVTFILHPNMRHFADMFHAPGVQILKQGEVDVQTLLRDHAALITDYSSVAFDFALQRRPVAYFQFDQEKFFGPHGTHLDLEQELPGPIVNDVDTLVDEVRHTAGTGFAVRSEYADRAARLVRYHDRRNCERVAASVRSAGGPVVQWWRLQDRRRAGGDHASDPAP
ncbi:CDP-glycerol glycerophosphotransferase (TagB/SpsB family) [Isoptericola sp. CG 20/1183]|uniref:CDP-glycerol glycerophosphotransferase (TagB/SpsB family) n=1 Tax=Isoptericola halotolerans TaxID=300560 RepID=A0ABX5EEI1_9MICO|nr:CDP-glycerol glycerophosphotransferase (TagB/SpsB family) [Isoptericola halotolerans]PRZ05430.1 CDP-glycerol glycerophosphotransferase (TagB/SpsB family) [Isoptericola sp. CG 20/1183]